jgi:hypothetical protein
MNARRLVFAVGLPVILLATAALAAAVPVAHHYFSGTSSAREAGGSLQTRSAPSRGQPAAQPQQLSDSHELLTEAKRHKTVSIVANVDYAGGGYGAYNPAALRDPWVQGVVINLDWRAVETSRGTFNWGPLDRTATTWADAGKHIVLVVRAANESGGGCSAGTAQMLPGWEITALHKARGRIGTFCDKDLHSLVPDWFSAAFQSNFRGFISALGKHAAAQPYYSFISYVRIGVGLGGEGFFLMPRMAGNRSYSADKSWMQANWHYTPQAWARFQETMLAAYHEAFPRQVEVIYPLDPQANLSPNNPGDLAVAKWATNHGGIGIGEECLPPGGLNSAFTSILSWVRNHHPNAYIQFQTCGRTATASAEHGIIKAAESYGAKSVEWYENTAVRPPSKSDMTAYQTWVNTTFKG